MEQTIKRNNTAIDDKGILHNSDSPYDSPVVA